MYGTTTHPLVRSHRALQQAILLMAAVLLVAAAMAVVPPRLERMTGASAGAPPVVVDRSDPAGAQHRCTLTGGIGMSCPD